MPRRRRFVRRAPRQRKLNVRQKREVKKIVAARQEFKRFPIYAGYASVTAGGTITKWTTIPQGDTVETRDGNGIRLSSVDLRLAMQQNNNTASSNCTFRVIIFQWTPDDAAFTPVVNNIIDTGFTQPVFSPIRRDPKQQFHIVYDRSFALTNSAAGPSHVVRHLRLYGKRLKKKITYTSNAGAGLNNLYVLVVTDTSVVNPSWAYGGYVVYTDG